MTATQEPVAIVGTACRAPGGLSSTEALWSAVLNKRDLVADSRPDSRWADGERVFPADLGEARMLHNGAYVEGVDQFDPGFFGIPAHEASSVDPQHRLLMETTWEALENSGVPPRSLAGSRTGMFVGISNNDYAKRFALADFDVYQGISAVSSGAPGRISYILDVHGPAMAVDGACASSLMAVHLACRSLHDGESDLAVAGGTTVQLEWGGTVGFARAGVLSDRGRCAAFDADADGFVRGDGCGVVVLKRLEDARRDGDPVLAVIRGTAVNHVGRTRGIAQPSVGAQRAVLRSAVRAAGIEPGRVGYVETHGTGTPVGDPIEFQAVADVYGEDDRPCPLGSLKTNIGHAESASGVLGLIKAATAVRTGLVPANLHFRSWNPEIDAADTRFFVPTDTYEWNATDRRLAGVSAFGVTGSNAHVLVEQADPSRLCVTGADLGRARDVDESSNGTEPVRPLVHPVSARSQGGLAATCDRLAEHLDAAEQLDLHDVAHTLSAHRSHLSTRACVVADDRASLVTALRAAAARDDAPTVVSGATSDPGMPVFVFSGHGSQWSGMARDLLDHDPTFSATIDRLEPVTAETAGFSLRRQLQADTLPERMDVVQPVVFAVQCALAQTWQAWGVRPAAVIGHSMGEAAAAVAAGILSLEDGMRITAGRSALLHRSSGGAMVSVALPHDRVEEEVAALADVDVAVVSAPSATVVAGQPDRVEELLQTWQERGIHCKRIPVPVAAHSPQVDPVLDELRDMFGWLAGEQPQVPFYSATIPPDEPVSFDTDYWVRNLRQPVRFDRASAAAIEDGHRVFLELSPHPLLLSAVDETATVRRASVLTVPSLLRQQNGRGSLCHAAAQLHVAGVPVDLDAVNGPGKFRALPPTAFDRSRYWEDSADRTRGAGRHLWLDEPVSVPDVDARDGTRVVWPADLGTDRVDWLAQHTLRGAPVVPGAAYVELVLAAATDYFRCGPERIGLTDVRFERLLPLADEVPVQVSGCHTDAALRIEIWRQSDGGWERVATAAATHTLDPPVGQDLEHAPAVEEGETDELYERFAGIGLDTGPAFHSIVGVGDDDTARVRVPAEATVRSAPPVVHPVLFDGCVLAVAACLPDAKNPPAGGGRPWLPDRIDTVEFAADPNQVHWVRPTLRLDSADSATGRADLYDDAGRWIGALDGVHLVKAAGPSPAQRLNNRLFELAWHPEPLPVSGRSEPTAWLVLREPGDPDGFADRLAAELESRGARVRLCDAGALPGDGPGDGPGPVDAVAWCATGALDEVARVHRVASTLREMDRASSSSPRLWLASRCARAVTDEDQVVPGIAALRGLVRVASFEQPEAATSWVDADDAGAAAAEMLGDTPETEVAWRNGTRHVARMVRAPLAEKPPRPEDRTVELVAGREEYVLRAEPGGGTLDQLALAPTTQPTPEPGPGEVLVRVTATTVHFRDVMVAYGIYPTEDGRLPELGGDATGVVVAVGPDVQDLRPGDAVVTIVAGGAGTMRSHIIARSDLTMPLPDGFDPTAVAAIPLTYVTAWYCLRDVGRLAPGEVVLVHSAAGGVGLAAVAVARLVGATVIATAGTEQKREYLRGLGVEHVFDSRTLEFVDGVRAATAGRGVDVVLNSLTGDAMRSSLDLLAPRGRFVEIGKRDLYDGRRVELATFRADNTYAACDIDLTTATAPKVIGSVLRQVLAELTEGRLPLLPHEHYPVADAAKAFKRLAAGDHIGRIVLEFAQDGQVVRARPAQETVVRPGGSYVITGGTRGLGAEAARWLAEAGAGRVVLGGRSGPSTDAQDALAQLERQGCAVEFVQGDIAEPETAEKLVAAAGDRLSGVLHTAVVLDDTPLSELTEEKLATVWHPKVSGLRNLHDATAGVDLDWFVVFSSMAAMLGNPGQTNYAVAGACVDAFAEWRRHAGLPALSVNWGAWGEAGRATDFTDRGFETIDTEEGFAALAALLEHRRVNTGVFTYQPDLMFRAFPHAADAPLLAELGGSVEKEAGSAAEAVRAEPPGPARVRLIQDVVIRELATVLGADTASIPAHDTFTDVGVDSLLSVALTRRLNTNLGINLAPAAVWANPSPAQLSTHVDELIDQAHDETSSYEEAR